MTINGFQFDCFDDDGNCKDFCKFDVLDLLELLMLEQSGVAVYLPSDIAITTTTSSTFSFFIAPGPGPLQNRASTASDNFSHLNDQQMPVNNDHTTHPHQNKKNDTSKTSTKKTTTDDPMAVMRQSRRKQGQLAFPYQDQFTYSLDFLDDKNFGKQ